MSESWIKITSDLPEHPKVDHVADILDIESDLVVGKLIRLWSLADKYTVDGRIPMSANAIDRKLELPGFADALTKVDWLEVGDGFVQIAKFDSHNSASAKKRAQDAKRNAVKAATKRHHRTQSDNNATSAASNATSVSFERELDEIREDSVTGTVTGSGAVHDCEPLRGSQHPPDSLDSTARSDSVFYDLTTDTLTDNEAFVDWFRMQASSEGCVFPNTEDGCLTACECAEHSLRKGRNPVAMFVRLATSDKRPQVVKDAQLAAKKRVEEIAKQRDSRPVDTGNRSKAESKAVTIDDSG